MGIINISELIGIIRKYFTRLLALSLAGALLVMVMFTYTQTFTCKLNYKYNYEKAAEGLAPDGVSKLDPYEIQNPTVIQGAINDLGLENDKNISVEGIRNHISVKEVVPTLDQEVSESAALLGEKYNVLPTEYEVSYSYSANWGDEFGAKIFDSIIKEYDKFLLNKYYNKKDIADFAKVLVGSTADHMEIADAMSSKLESIIEYLDSLTEYYPDYRSKRTGFSFAELSQLYQNLRDIQYAKYYGNIRAGNLAKDSEMIIKSYQEKVKDLNLKMGADNEMATTYKNEITAFYDSYKKTGLYNQASRIQTTPDSSNNRDQNVFDNFDMKNNINTYDSIIVNYTKKATDASDKARTLENYNAIINSFATDSVDAATKQRLLAKNEEVFQEICTLSKQYSQLANETVNEYYNAQLGKDLVYLVTSDVGKDKPVGFITVFAFILLFAFAMIAVIVYEIYKNIVRDAGIAEANRTDEEIAAENLDEFHSHVYDQYKKGFNEFHLEYQPMFNSKTNESTNYEVFVRWENEELGAVSPVKAIEYLTDLHLLKAFNGWLLENICKTLKKCQDRQTALPVFHINCPKSEIEDFGLNSILVKFVNKYQVPADHICFEIDGDEIADSAEDITLLKEMGVQICIDHFESKDEENEIIELVEPDYIKMSSDVLHYDMLATTDAELVKSAKELFGYFAKVMIKCAKKNIKVCICGIEDSEQDKLVTELGFDFKQGFYYAKPRREIEEKGI